MKARITALAIVALLIFSVGSAVAVAAKPYFVYPKRSQDVVISISPETQEVTLGQWVEYCVSIFSYSGGKVTLTVSGVPDSWEAQLYDTNGDLDSQNRVSVKSWQAVVVGLRMRLPSDTPSGTVVTITVTGVKKPNRGASDTCTLIVK